MGSKRLRTVIQTDESLSPKIHGQTGKPVQCLSPQINWAFWRGVAQFVHRPAKRQIINCVIYWHPSLPLQPSLTPCSRCCKAPQRAGTSVGTGCVWVLAMAAEGSCCHLEGPEWHWLFFSLTQLLCPGMCLTPWRLCQQPVAMWGLGVEQRVCGGRRGCGRTHSPVRCAEGVAATQPQAQALALASCSLELSLWLRKGALSLPVGESH